MSTSFLLGVVVRIVAVAAQTPQTAAEIPIYPGAVRDVKEEQPDNNTRFLRFYRTTAGIDDVVKFYGARFHPREATEGDTAVGAAWYKARETLKPGQTTPALLDLTFVNFEARECTHGGCPDPPAISRARYAKHRAPYRPGAWVSRASLEWARLDREGRLLTSYEVGLTDEGDPESRHGGDPNATAIEIREREEPYAQVEGQSPLTSAEHESADEPAGEKPPLAEPSAVALGVPTYPGARFDPRMSGGLSSEREQSFVYTTADPPDKVLAFYEQRTGKKATLKSEAGWLIPVKGEGLFPELGVWVQPNAGAYPASVKTMIGVRHAQKKSGAP